MNITDSGQYFVEKMCEGCGCKFVVPNTSSWAYKILYNGRHLFFCSWHCLNHNRVGKTDERKTIREDRKLLSLRAIRDHFGYTRQEIAAYLGINAETYMYYENLCGILSLKRMKLLADGFGCTVKDLIATDFDKNKAAEWNCKIPHKK